jgi:hypothetical protein
MAQQTSVEWLFETMAKTPMTEWYQVLEQAKEMHKEEIKKAWISAWKDSMINPLEDKYYEPEAENYYNETFKK